MHSLRGGAAIRLHVVQFPVDAAAGCQQTVISAASTLILRL